MYYLMFTEITMSETPRILVGYMIQEVAYRDFYILVVSFQQVDYRFGKTLMLNKSILRLKKYFVNYKCL